MQLMIGAFANSLFGRCVKEDQIRSAMLIHILVKSVCLQQLMHSIGVYNDRIYMVYMHLFGWFCLSQKMD